jgi:hypothetical protein
MKASSSKPETDLPRQRKLTPNNASGKKRTSGFTPGSNGRKRLSLSEPVNLVALDSLSSLPDLASLSTTPSSLSVRFLTLSEVLTLESSLSLLTIFPGWVE